MTPFRLMPASALALALLSCGVSAQTWPARPPHAIVPVAAGTITDIVPRVVFEPLSAQLGQTIIVENRPGGGATTAAGFVAKADPDGYTILVNSTRSRHAWQPRRRSGASQQRCEDWVFLAIATPAATPAPSTDPTDRHGLAGWKAAHA